MLWAITSYFNPSGFKIRPANYRTFRKYLAAPLVAVELSFNGRFELRQGDAEILVQLVGRDVLWQKERLLNVALQHLPNDCDTVAWLDCDVVLDGADGLQRACAALETFSLVQPFKHQCYLKQGAASDPSHSGGVDFIRPGVAYGIAIGEHELGLRRRLLGKRLTVDVGFPVAGAHGARPGI